MGITGQPNETYAYAIFKAASVGQLIPYLILNY
jgi:hypothetical protein